MSEDAWEGELNERLRKEHLSNIYSEIEQLGSEIDALVETNLGLHEQNNDLKNSIYVVTEENVDLQDQVDGLKSALLSKDQKLYTSSELKGTQFLLKQIEELRESRRTIGDLYKDSEKILIELSSAVEYYLTNDSTLESLSSDYYRITQKYIDKKKEV